MTKRENIRARRILRHRRRRQRLAKGARCIERSEANRQHSDAVQFAERGNIRNSVVRFERENAKAPARAVYARKDWTP
jgi:hypothetical protein